MASSAGTATPSPTAEALASLPRRKGGGHRIMCPDAGTLGHAFTCRHTTAVGDGMPFLFIPAWSGDAPDRAILQGIAEGLNDLFPVPQHPGSVAIWLTSADGDQAAHREQAPRHEGSPREMFHEP